VPFEMRLIRCQIRPPSDERRTRPLAPVDVRARIGPCTASSLRREHPSTLQGPPSARLPGPSRSRSGILGTWYSFTDLVTFTLSPALPLVCSFSPPSCTLASALAPASLDLRDTPSDAGMEMWPLCSLCGLWQLPSPAVLGRHESRPESALNAGRAHDVRHGGWLGQQQARASGPLSSLLERPAPWLLAPRAAGGVLRVYELEWR